MATEKKILSIFQFRRDTTENWLANKDIVPAAGEPCYDIDLRTLRIGDGTTTYENLPIVGNTEVSDGVDSINFAGVDMIETDGVFSIDQLSARQALGINVPDDTEGQEVVIATDSSVNAMSEELKAYVDEQIATGGTGKMDYGEI